MQGWIFVVIGVFLAVLAVVYWISSYEDAGTVLLVAASALCLFAGVFLLVQQGRFGSGAEDAPDATMAEGAGDVGVFPTATAWPFAVGVAMTVTFNGLIAGPWMLVTGGVMLLIALVGYVYSTVWSPGD